ncbi:unnamed protein product [Diamesa serratosioi]
MGKTQTKVQTGIPSTQKDKVLVLKLRKLSPDYIEARKYPKRLKQTAYNQFGRCARFYIESTIKNLLPLMKKNPPLLQPKVKVPSKLMLDEARKFIGEKELPKRTRGQQKVIYISAESSPCSVSDVIHVPQLAIKKAKKIKKNSISQIKGTAANNPEFGDVDCNDLSIPTSNIMEDIVPQSAEVNPTSVDNCKLAKKCKTPEKTNRQPKLKTPNFIDKIPHNALDMPDLSDSVNCQLNDLTMRPKIAIKLKKCISNQYEVTSEISEDKEQAPKKPESPSYVRNSTSSESPDYSSSFTKDVGKGKSIGYKDLESMKHRRKKLSSKTINSNRVATLSKKPMIGESSLKKKLKPYHRPTARESLFSCSETSDSDMIPLSNEKVGCGKTSSNELKGKILRPRRDSLDFDKSKMVLKKLERKSLYEHLFGKDIDDIITSSNNEESQKDYDEVTNNMNDTIISMTIPEVNNKNDTGGNKNIVGEDAIMINQDDSINIINSNNNYVIEEGNNTYVSEEGNNNGSRNDEADESDVMSLCADDDFIEDFDMTAIALSPKKVDSPVVAEPAWSAELEDCRMTLRKDTTKVLNADNATRNFNKNTKTIVNNMPTKIPSKEITMMLNRVFNGLCVDFINDNCKDKCKHRHEFPTDIEVRENMRKVNLTIIENAYEFVKLHQKLFLMYFQVFCDVFSFFKLPNRLKSMFVDCERHTRTIDYYRHVVAGLEKTGMLKYKSIRLCIENTTDTPYSRDTITNMIAETGPDVVRFVDYLTHCGTLPITLFNKIMEHCVTYQNPDLQYFLLSSFQQVLHHESVASQVNQANMIKLIQLIKRSQGFNNGQIEESLVSVLEKVCSV